MGIEDIRIEIGDKSATILVVEDGNRQMITVGRVTGLIFKALVEWIDELGRKVMELESAEDIRQGRVVSSDSFLEEFQKKPPRKRREKVKA